MSLLTSGEKTILQAQIGNIHDTWKRQIVAYKTPDVTIISSDTNYNFAFKTNQESTTVQNVPVSGTYNVRIFQPTSRNDFEKAVVLTDIPLSQIKGAVRLKMEDDAWTFIKDSIKVVIDGETYDRMTEDRHHGLFTPEYHTVWFLRTE